MGVGADRQHKAPRYPSPGPSSQAGGERLKAATRIQRKNRATILDAALGVFSAHGFRGSTLDRIAEEAGMSKPNLLYYFASKEAIYVEVLGDILAEWLRPLAELDPAGDPLCEIGGYIKAKLDMSRKKPAASRLFANEVLDGAPAIRGFLRGPLKNLVAEKAAVISGWMAEGKLASADPSHLNFMIWAVTQHYADFDVQVRAVLGAPESDDGHFTGAETTVLSVFLRGLLPCGGPADRDARDVRLHR